VAGPLYDGSDGATCTFRNQGARIAWAHRLGDWQDAAGTAQGPRAFATVKVRPGDASHSLRIDVTGLARAWLDGRYANEGLFLMGAAGQDAGVALFHSREAADAALRPVLILTLRNGGELKLDARADTTLDCSTYQSLGARPTLSAGSGHRAALQFDLPGTPQPVVRATLELTVERAFGDVTLGVFRIDPAAATSPRPTAGPGIAARYPRDAGIGKDADVLMATGFEDASWRRAWSYVDPRSAVEIVERPTAQGFAPLQGRALQVRIPAGQNLGLDMGYRFAGKAGREPEEIWFRYYLRLGHDWMPRDGGKLPGLSATYSQAGWGGRKADGSTGWSMRGNFAATPSPGNPYRGRTPIGTYAYHADMQDQFGDAWPWSGDGSVLARDRWYCIEQYVKVNRPGVRDGVIRAWVDGVPVFERTGLHLRDIDSIRIEQVWMNVYFGGTDPTPADLHLFIDNVVVARSYIGPMAP
jgi:hypothetical protein